MGTCLKIIVAVFFLVLGQVIFILNYVPPLPNMGNTWWGSEIHQEENSIIRPFRVNVSPQIVEDLKSRLSAARPFTPPLENIQHQYGVNTKLLKEMVEFWKNIYNWTEREQFLNEFPQYTTKIQGLRIHFVRVVPKVEDENLKVVPILLLHGWPSSVREFYGIIPLVTTPKKDRKLVFEVVAPSLPGFIYSEATTKPGLGGAQMAVVLKNLMLRLGHDKFYVHGGDIGAVIAQHMATLYPQYVEGFHSNLCLVYTPLANLKLYLGSLYPPAIVQKKYEHKVYPLSETFLKTYWLEKGYTHIQATKPDTIGIPLGDSPVGLAAYILEKFITWTHSEAKNLEDGGLKNKFTFTELIDNIMLYWVTNSMTTAMRFYAETLNKEAWTLGIDENPILVPSACTRYVNDYYYYPDSILREKFKKLVYTADYDDIGHFAALEAPEVFAEDLLKAVEIIISSKTT